MKKLFTLMLITAAVAVNAQDLLIDDFELSSNSWVTVSCYSDVRDNAHKEGLNLSNKTLYIVRAPGCENWSGAMYTPASPISGYKYLHVYMHRNNGNKPNLKISDNLPSGAASLDLEPMNAVAANQWQDVVFDISAFPQADFLFIMADRTNITADAELYCDQIMFSNSATPRTEVLKPTEEQPVTPVDPSADDEGYYLMWSDEFDGTALNRNCWTPEIGWGDNGWGNWELQYYTDDAITVKDGNLVITATKRDYEGRPATSGRMISRDKVYFTYGKVVASIKFPNLANGLWPAFWMMGNDITQVGWPRCGETDIVEMGNATGISQGTQDRYFNGASHWGENWPQASAAGAGNAPYSITDGQYHTFTCIWTPTQMRMYLDRDKYPDVAPYHTLDISDHSGAEWNAGTYFNKPNFLLLNLAVGGTFTGIDNISGVTALNNGPRSMYVDYVRVYQKGDEGETFFKPNATALNETSAASVMLYPNPATDFISVSSAVNSLQIVDMQGRVVLTSIESQVSVAHLPAGLYLARIKANDGSIITSKFFKR